MNQVTAEIPQSWAMLFHLKHLRKPYIGKEIDTNQYYNN